VAGHRGGPIERIQELWAIWQGGLDVAPRLSVDAGQLQAYLTEMAAELEQPPRDAALSFAEGKVLPTAARPGRQVLADASAIDIMRGLQTLEPQSVVLRTRTLAPANVMPERNAESGTGGSCAAAAAVQQATAATSKRHIRRRSPWRARPLAHPDRRPTRTRAVPTRAR